MKILYTSLRFCSIIFTIIFTIFNLSYLATTDFYTTIASSYCVGISTVANIVPDVTKAIWDSWVDTFLPVPKAADWQEIALSFKEMWNFPNCMGANDRKHVEIQAPPNSGSRYFNCKRTYSILCSTSRSCRCKVAVQSSGCWNFWSKEQRRDPCCLHLWRSPAETKPGSPRRHFYFWR